MPTNRVRFGAVLGPLLAVSLFASCHSPSEARQAAFDVQPAQVLFGPVPVGETLDRDVTITNRSATEITLGVYSALSDGPFSIVSGGGEFSLAPAEARVLTVRFTPTDGVSFVGSLAISHSLGAADPTPVAIQLRGVGDGLDRAAVIAALDYWQAAAGISYVLVEEDVEPRLLIICIATRSGIHPASLSTATKG